MASPSGMSRVDRRTAWGSPVRSARFVDASREEALGRIGIATVGDLVTHWPFRYLDLTTTLPLSRVKQGDEVTVVGTVRRIQKKQPRPRLSIVEVAITDETGSLIGVWFNQPYIADRFLEGERVAFAGKVELDFGMHRITAPFVEKLGAPGAAQEPGRVLPVHRTTEGLTTNWLRRLVAAAIDDYADVPDFLPVELRVARGLMSLRASIRAMHFPSSVAEATEARRRLAYEELFCLQLGLLLRHHSVRDGRPGHAHDTDGAALSALAEEVPFDLTEDQAAAIADILKDLASSRPMNRLLLGDVGTGKTIVAAHALAAVADSGTQAAMMAPTEVLAVQYAEKVGPLLDAIGVTWRLLTGSTPAAERPVILDEIARGEASVVFGTHALIEGTVTYAALTLAIVDEQHRFGVQQRLALRRKGEAVDMLVMTATPIPRSLALTRFGDLDTTYLRERPHGDVAVRATTQLVDRRHREEAYEAVRRAVDSGMQAYVVCPLVDESDAIQARSALKEADRLATEVFSDLRVGVLTGKMKSAERLDVMRRFRDGALDVLVSTTVIEVGVDVPRATVMIIEDAERFGLAQLHQLRGRVGRGAHPGEVYLFADPKTEEGRVRMDAIVTSRDGFALAEQDLVLRGPGQLLGVAQHGLPELGIASLVDDAELLECARADAAEVLESDPELARPVNRPLMTEVRSRFEGAGGWMESG